MKNEKMIKKLKPISKYDFYREYLNEVFLVRKHSRGGCTLAQFARSFAMGGSAFQMILTGSRNLTILSVHQIANAINLSPAEREYFEALVLFEQVDDSEARNFYRQRMKRMTALTGAKRQSIGDQRLLADWRVAALLIYIHDYVDTRSSEWIKTLNFARLSMRLRLPEEKLRTMVKEMIQAGIIEIDEKDQTHFKFEKMKHRLAQKNFVRSVMKESLDRLEKEFESTQSVFQTYTLSLPQHQLARLRAEVETVFERYMELESGASPEIMQASLSIYSVI